MLPTAPGNPTSIAIEFAAITVPVKKKNRSSSSFIAFPFERHWICPRCGSSQGGAAAPDLSARWVCLGQINREYALGDRRLLPCFLGGLGAWVAKFKNLLSLGDGRLIRPFAGVENQPYQNCQHAGRDGPGQPIHVAGFGWLLAGRPHQEMVVP